MFTYGHIDIAIAFKQYINNMNRKTFNETGKSNYC